MTAANLRGRALDDTSAGEPSAGNSGGDTGSVSSPADPAAHRASRLLIIATVEIPTDREWTPEQMERDVRSALTDYGYFVVRADVEPMT